MQRLWLDRHINIVNMTDHKITENQENQEGRLEVEYYGADFPVEVLVKRMDSGDFVIPNFQRGYVWEETEASRFIESLLLGLPTPSLFLAKDKFSNQYLVIDGQQRLKTLQAFYKESFPDRGKPFKLKDVVPELQNLSYTTLSISQRRALDNAIVHCIIISENYDLRGIYHLFERLNTTGIKLVAQEIRNAIYRGKFSELLQELSNRTEWQRLCQKSGQLVTWQELILRFLALYYNLENYNGKMVTFLNDFMLENKEGENISLDEMKKLFLDIIHFILKCTGETTFLRGKTFSITLFESIMLVVAQEISSQPDCLHFKKFWKSLIDNEDFQLLSRASTTSTKNLKERLELAKSIYQNTSK